VARRVFGDVYRQLCEVHEVAPERIAENAVAFRDLFGLVRGRVLYNRTHRHRILALLPGLALAGEEIVPAALPADPPGTPPIPPGALPAPLLLASRALGVPARLLRDTARLEGEVKSFRERVARELEPLVSTDFSERTADELRALYLRLDRELLAHWHGPMLNDGLVEHWDGVLSQMLGMWLPDAAPILGNQLVAGDGGIVSTEPVRRLAELGERAGADEGLRALLLDESLDDAAVWRRLTTDPAFAEMGAELRAYLERFGDRCADELKLEALTYADEPAVVVGMLRRYAAIPPGTPRPRSGAEIRAAAEADVRARLAAGHQVAFFAVLDRVRRLTRDRENLRFERTRAFGVIRRIFLAIGERLAAAGALASPRDIFYLAEDEVFAYLDGTSPLGADLRPVVEARRAEFAEYARAPEPPDICVTHGPPALSPLEPYTPPPPPGMTVVAMPRVEGMLRGMGCCPGVVRAPVRVVHDPRHAGGLAGRILVAQQTDPGWTLLFPAAAGVLVQRGSILSHAALVAREMGIPCVVGIPGLLDTLSDGDVVEMDGATGIIRRISGG
jgi:pyruvate,water dikinase